LITKNYIKIFSNFTVTLLLFCASISLGYAEEVKCSLGGFGHEQNITPVKVSCEPTIHHVPRTCCDLDSKEPYYSRDRSFVCEDGSQDCIEIINEYNSCAGPIGPFIVDEQDNVYFWSGRGHLHSLDKDGKLRWRFEFCEKDTFFSQMLEQCKDLEDSSVECTATRTAAFIYSTVMDYHGTLFFFAGSYLYALDSQSGELIHRTQIEHPELGEDEKLIVSNGVLQSNSSQTHFRGGDMVLTPEGLIYATYIILKRKEGSSGKTALSKGTMTLDRRGNVKSYSAKAGEGTYGSAHLIGFNRDEYLSIIDDEVFHNDSHVDITPVTSNRQDRYGSYANGIQGNSAISTDGKAYFLSADGYINAMDMATREVKSIFKMPGLNDFSWHNKITLDEENNLWLIADPRYVFTPVAMHLDTSLLWETPQLLDTYCPRRVHENSVLAHHCSENYLKPEEYTINYEEVPGVTHYVAGWGGAFSTPLIGQKNIYLGIGGLHVYDRAHKHKVWQFGMRTPATAPAMLSDGTIVVGQSSNGRVFFLKERDTDSPVLSSWPRANHDNYMSRHRDHPHRWDRSGKEPYKKVTELMYVEKQPTPDMGEMNASDMGTPYARDDMAQISAMEPRDDHRQNRDTSCNSTPSSVPPGRYTIVILIFGGLLCGCFRQIKWF